MPSFEVGWGGAGSEGGYTPLTEGEGMGHGTQGWGLGMQGRYVAGGWSFSATILALRNHGHTTGILQRAAITYQTESGWRAALEQAPRAWGSGLNGGDLLGDASRSFPRLSLSTPEAALPLGRWRLEAFTGKLDDELAIPDWIADRPARVFAKVAGLDLQRPTLLGGLVRASFGTLLDASFGTLRLAGGRDAQGRPAPSSSARAATLAELRLRFPALATFVRARGASVYVSGSAAPDGSAVTLAQGRELGGLQLVWDSWDLGLEYAGASPRGAAASFLGPTYLAGFSTQGDSLGPAFGSAVITRTVELGLPLFLEGRGRLKLVRATAPLGDPSGAGSWFLQADAQWRTSTGKAGASLASRRDAFVASARWGWAFSVFQSFRVF